MKKYRVSIMQYRHDNTVKWSEIWHDESRTKLGAWLKFRRTYSILDSKGSAISQLWDQTTPGGSTYVGTRWGA